MKYYSRYKFLILVILVFLIGKLTEWNVLFPRFDNSYAQKFQKIINNKERELQSYILYIEKTVRTTPSPSDVQNNLIKFNEILDKEGYGILLYKNDSLVYWNDNRIIAENIYPFSDNSVLFRNLKNAWYVSKIHQVGKWKIVGLILIKQVYKYENNYLVNEFQRDFNFPSTVKTSSRQVQYGYPIFDSNGMYIFSLVFDKTCQHKWFQQYIPVLAYFSAIILLGFFVCQTANLMRNFRRKRLFLLGVIILAIGLKILTGYYHYPTIFYELDLFQPQNMAISDFIPSLGDLFLWVVLIFFISYLLYENFKFFPINLKDKNQRYLLLIIVSVILYFSFLLINVLIRNMILNSSISFEANKVLLLSAYSFLGYLIFIMLFVSYSFLADRSLSILSDYTNIKAFSLVFISVSVILNLLLWPFSISLEPIPLLILVILINLISYFRIFQRSGYQYSGLVLVVLVFSIYTVDRVIELTLFKNRSETKVLASNLANQHDQVAEYLMEEHSNKISKDSIISHLLFSPDSVNVLNKYLTSKYFNGYFEKYSLQVIPCTESDSLYLRPPDDYYIHCRSYFTHQVDSIGSKLPSSSFYYIDNQTGRASYLGWFEYVNPATDKIVTLFLVIDSKVLTDKIGYPELLLDKEITQKSKFRDYSYAKYYNGTLITKYGYYPYDLSSKDFTANSSKEEYTNVKLNGFNHLIYWYNKKDIIVISYPKVGLFEVLIAFSWIFLFFLLLITIVSLFTNLPLIQKAFRANFKNKIQFSIMAVLFTSLILIGGGTILFSIKQYNNRHYDTLEEKMRSIYVEVFQTVNYQGQIYPDLPPYPYESLDELLMNFWDVFYADINLFDPSGNLIATSRREIFEKSLISTKINSTAYHELAFNKRAQFIQSEKIGSLNYLSGYIPLLNYDNKLLGYLNIPYFIRQEEMKHEISNLVVGIVNVYVILLLISILISILISRRITMPLRMIQEKFSEIKLVQNYNRIEYKENDEIGGLVKEYNSMVAELEKSIELLAKSERESAWREMARQIAHEINNPLTPMKLSVQHLLRAHKDKSDKFDEYLERIARTLIEEIDNLSSIATEFSNFAKMPQAHNHKLNLVEKLNTVVNLFSNSEADFILNFNNHKVVDIFADKEQISRVFINLFKNAIQAVEKGGQPIIKIDLNVENDKVTVYVADNGNGIPEELREKLFRPNFTTKSSGMGLGLAIIKNIIEDIGGTIRFVTETGKGTTFILEFPVFNKKKNLW